MRDDLGDRMKMYEAMNEKQFLPYLPVMARIDGRCFSKFTKGMNRPYDERMSECMINTTKKLVGETGALVGYTQSDEITLMWYSDSINSQIWFDGKHSKMVSQLGSLSTLYFYKECERLLGKEFLDKMPTFDARVWQVPSKEEAVNVFLWREKDATKNSISMAAREYYSHRQLENKNSNQKQDMLFEAGINWNDYPDYFKRGTYVRKIMVEKQFSVDEIEKLPKNHAARTNPELKIKRSELVVGSSPINSTFIFKKQMLFGD